MKKRLSIIILSLLLAVGQLSAQAIASTQRLVGYCDGDSITLSGVGFSKADTYTVGALATSSLLGKYAGCKIVGIRFAISESIGKTSVFIAPVSDGKVGDNLVNQVIRHTGEGWNTVFFNSGNEYDITGSESLLFGFSFEQTDDMISSNCGPLDIYIPESQLNNCFLAKQSSDTGWSDCSENGALCVQLIVDVSSLPEKKVGLSNLLIGTYYKNPGDKINYYIEYQNIGRETIGNCQLGMQIDDGEITYIDQSDTLNEDASQSIDAYLTLPGDIATGSHVYRFFTTKIDGQDVGDAVSEIEQPFVVYRNAMKRQKHYVEQYNSQQSYYASLVNDGMNKVADTDDNVCLVNIYDDESPLSVAESEPFINMYAYTYPCYTVDRFYFFGESHTAFDVNDYVTVYPAIVTEGLRSIVYEANSNPAFASIDIQPEYNAEGREFTLNISGKVSDEALKIYDSLALTVMLTEDNVKGKQTCLNTLTNKTSNNNNYIHNNVLRTYVSQPTGDEITCNGNTFSTSYTVKVSDEWKPENMKAVAFITRKADAITEANMRQMDITNCNSISLYDIVNTITSITQDSSSATHYYTLDGKPVDGENIQKGIYIRKDDQHIQKVIIK